MHRRIAKKILKQLATTDREWRTSTLRKANDVLYGRHNRGMLAYIAWTRKVSPAAAATAISFASLAKTVKDSMWIHKRRHVSYTLVNTEHFIQL